MSNVHPEGMCKDCRVEPGEPGPGDTVRSRCRGCADTRNAEAKVAREARKRKGLCSYPGGCEKRVSKGRAQCKEHLEYYAARMRVAS